MRSMSDWASDVEGARFAAELADGRSAALAPVEVIVASDGVWLKGATFWPREGLQIEDLGAGLLHLQHPAAAPGALLSSRAVGLGAALAAVGMAPAGFGNRRILRRAAFYLGSLVAVLVAAYAAIPTLSRALARRVPLEVEQRLGAQAELLFADSLCRNAEVDAALGALGGRLAGTEGTAPRGIAVVNWQLVNAFTLPGGQVLLTRGLLDEAQGPDEIAGVLAHELEHVRQRHVMTAVIRGSILSLGWAATVGDFSGLLVIDPSTAFSLATQGFSRDDERAADQGALERLDAAGISRTGLIAFFQRMQAETDALPAWLGNHPSSQERLATLAAGTPAKATTPALTDTQWRALKSACAGQAPVRDPLRALLGR
jgi:predicted Zn-dependent protease